jgi:hypothetical protein
MKKPAIAGLLLALLASPAGAHSTKPGDVVQVESETYDSFGATVTSHKLYSKPWGQIKVDAATVRTIDAFIHKWLSNSPESVEKEFRIVHLRIIDNNVTHAVLLGKYGTVLVADIAFNTLCFVSVSGNGGPAEGRCGE